MPYMRFLPLPFAFAATPRTRTHNALRPSPTPFFACLLCARIAACRCRAPRVSRAGAAPGAPFPLRHTRSVFLLPVPFYRCSLTCCLRAASAFNVALSLPLLLPLRSLTYAGVTAACLRDSSFASSGRKNHLKEDGCRAALPLARRPRRCCRHGCRSLPASPRRAARARARAPRTRVDSSLSRKGKGVKRSFVG